MPAYYRCKWCEGTHRVPEQHLDGEDVASTSTARHVLSCPEEERGAIYRRADLFWRATPLESPRRLR